MGNYMWFVSSLYCLTLHSCCRMITITLQNRPYAITFSKTYKRRVYMVWISTIAVTKTWIPFKLHLYFNFKLSKFILINIVNITDKISPNINSIFLMLHHLKFNTKYVNSTPFLVFDMLKDYYACTRFTYARIMGPQFHTRE